MKHIFSRGEELKYMGPKTVTSESQYDTVSSLVTEGYIMTSGETLLLEGQHYWKSLDFNVTEVKQDQGKLRYDLMPFDALDAVAEVLTYGIKKYPKPEENWRVNSTLEDIPRYKAARLRHISLAAQGQVFDEESGLPHEWHISTNSLFIIALEKMYGVYNV